MRKRSVLSQGLRNIYRLFSPRTKRIARDVAKETVEEGKRLSEMAMHKAKQEAPNIKRVLKKETTRYAENVKKAISPPKKSRKTSKRMG
ncbi:MAG: hypothetical protein AABW49_01170 [Nanoarchaeota archaeon]